MKSRDFKVLNSHTSRLLSIMMQADGCGALKCRKPVSKGIMCDCCGFWYHLECAGISDSMYDIQAANDDLQWLCYICLASAEDASRRSNRCALASAGDDPHKDAFVLQAKEIEKLQERVSTLEKELSHLRIESDIALGRNRNILIFNNEEPVIRDAKARADIELRRVRDIMRMAGLPPYTLVKRVQRIGSWTKATDKLGQRVARPILVEFGNPAARDQVLCKSELICRITGGRYQITPDNQARKLRNPEPRDPATMMQKIAKLPAPRVEVVKCLARPEGTVTTQGRPTKASYAAVVSSTPRKVDPKPSVAAKRQANNRISVSSRKQGIEGINTLSQPLTLRVSTPRASENGIPAQVAGVTKRGRKNANERKSGKNTPVRSETSAKKLVIELPDTEAMTPIASSRATQTPETQVLKVERKVSSPGCEQRNEAYLPSTRSDEESVCNETVIVTGSQLPGTASQCHVETSVTGSRENGEEQKNAIVPRVLRPREV